MASRDKSPERRAKVGQPPRNSRASRSTRHSRSSSRSVEEVFEEPTHQHPVRAKNYKTHTGGHHAYNNMAQDHARVQYGDRYDQVHVHNYHERNQRTSVPFSDAEQMSAGQEERMRAEEAMTRLAYARMDVRKDTIEPAFHNTCKWLFDRPEYKDWRNPKCINDHHGFLWIKSKPGAGKSTLMKFIVESSWEQFCDDSVISFFFNARGDAEEKSLTGLYRSLLHQLLEAVPELQSPDLMKKVTRIATQGWTLQALKNLFHMVVLQVRHERITCIIDALDESVEDEIRDLVDHLENLCTLLVAKGCEFRVCFSSRHYPHVELDKCQYLNLDELDEHQQDIALYVKRKLSSRRGTVADDILLAVQSRSQGVFLWAVLVTQILKKDYDRGDIHKVRDRLCQIPDGLHELFREIISRGTDDDDEKDSLVSILQWIAYARYPLTLQELYLAIRSGHPSFDPIQLVNNDNPNGEMIKLYILNSSKGLAELIRDREGQLTVQFIHESVKDYLQEAGFQILTLKTGRALHGSAHDHLKQCCYRWISNLQLQNLLTQRNTDLRGLSLLPYAVDNTIYHAELAHANGIPQTNFVNSFPFDTWKCSSDVISPIGSDRIRTLMALLVREHAIGLLATELQRRSSRQPWYQYESAFSSAVRVNCLECLKMILGNGALLGCSASQQVSALQTVIRGDNMKALELMLEHVVQAIPPHDYPAVIALAILNCKEHSNVIDWWWPADFCRPEKSHAQTDRLYHTLLQRCDASLRSLGDRGLDLDRQDLALCRVIFETGSGITPSQDMLRRIFLRACVHGHETVVKACVRKGCNCNEHLDDRPLFCVVAARAHSHVLEILFDNGARPMLGKGKYFYNALLEASRSGHDEVVRILLSNEAAAWHQHGGYYGFVMEETTIRGHERVAKTLLDFGAGFRDQDKEIYRESLCLAISKGYNGIAQILRDWGVKLAQETLPPIECAQSDAWVNNLPETFFKRDSIPDPSNVVDYLEDEML